VMLNSGADIPGAWMMMQDITRIISPNNVWPGLPKEEKERPSRFPVVLEKFRAVRQVDKDKACRVSQLEIAVTV